MKTTIFEQPLRVINIGLQSFAETILQEQGDAIHLAWHPPANGDRRVGHLLSALYNEVDISQANEKAFHLFLSAEPYLEDVAEARTILPELRGKIILHAGPPISWDAMCGPMQGAMIGAILFEGWAASVAEAESLAASGKITFEPAHHYNAVGPMSGVISPSMPLWVVKEKHTELRVYSNLNEGLGKVLRFGANDSSVLDRLTWMRTVLSPVLSASLRAIDSINLKTLQAQALHMGDEVHNRNAAASALFLKKILPGILSAQCSEKEKIEVINFISNNDHFFLNLSMASSNAMLQAIGHIPNSTLVTVMSRNGVEFGIRTSGSGDTWFVAPAPVVDGLFFPGYTVDDAAPDLGDSAITETAGLGGFAMAASPAIVQFVGGNSDDALEYSKEMRSITHGQNPSFTIPALNFAGTATLIDVRKVIDSNILPIINTGIAHKHAGVGQVGAGVTRAPMECFTQALTYLYTQRGNHEK